MAFLYLAFVLACRRSLKWARRWGNIKDWDLLTGRVVRFAESLSVKIPHTGWNQVEARKDALLFNQVNARAYVYFNHSYYCQPRESSDILATTEYGLTYACAVQRGNIFGVQFHPEKSQAVGLRILKNFLEGSMSFTIFPAIDLRAGRVVRLKEGDPDAHDILQR